eukprot:TRINITY_DN1574_c0_g1_i1.p1 TRINITY_DN1574_c0_g1~~TRINITY_DN1574_c0_g1_i1.p1  ORF type:complete len:516 (-),score=110.05 TRINITY_DN1574_c0_g1_i1:18-1565(-)
MSQSMPRGTLKSSVSSNLKSKAGEAMWTQIKALLECAGITIDANVAESEGSVESLSATSTIPSETTTQPVPSASDLGPLLVKFLNRRMSKTDRPTLKCTNAVRRYLGVQIQYEGLIPTGAEVTYRIGRKQDKARIVIHLDGHPAFFLPPTKFGGQSFLLLRQGPYLVAGGFEMSTSNDLVAEASVPDWSSSDFQKTTSHIAAAIASTTTTDDVSTISASRAVVSLLSAAPSTISVSDRSQMLRTCCECFRSTPNPKLLKTAFVCNAWDKKLITQDECLALLESEWPSASTRVFTILTGQLQDVEVEELVELTHELDIDGESKEPTESTQVSRTTENQSGSHPEATKNIDTKAATSVARGSGGGAGAEKKKNEKFKKVPVAGVDQQKHHPMTYSGMQHDDDYDYDDSSGSGAGKQMANSATFAVDAGGSTLFTPALNGSPIIDGHEDIDDIAGFAPPLKRRGSFAATSFRPGSYQMPLDDEAMDVESSSVEDDFNLSKGNGGSSNKKKRNRDNDLY